MPQVIDLTCPGCGASVSISQKECEWCHKPIVISSFSAVSSMSSLEINKYAGSYRKALANTPDNPVLNNAVAFCYFKLRLYDKALSSFEKAMEDDFDNPETFFYAAVCLLNGKKAFLQSRPVIDKICEYVNAATMIEGRGIFYYFLAYIKYDYFARKAYRTSPTYAELLKEAENVGVSEYDKDALFELLGVSRPSCM